jgi:hypothetical protein
MKLEAKQRLLATRYDLNDLGTPSINGKLADCFENARKECKARPSSEYHIGMARYILSDDRSKTWHSTLHAWCVDKGKVIDSTPYRKKGNLAQTAFAAVEYIPWAAFDVDKITKPASGIPEGEAVLKVFKAAKGSSWDGSEKWKSIPKKIRDNLQP